jgi:hypothetical protein
MNGRTEKLVEAPLSQRDMFNPDSLPLIKARSHKRRLDLLKIYVCYLCVVAVKDLCDLLKSRAAGLNVEDDDEEKLQENPALSTISTE